MEDYKEVVMDMNLMDIENNNVGKSFNITVSYNSLIVYARKRKSCITPLRTYQNQEF